MRYFILLALCGSLLACNSNNTNEQEDQLSPEQMEEQALYDAAIEDHDVVMPKFSVIQQTQIELENYLENEAIEEELRKRIMLAIDKMETANDAMMEWMGKISPPSKLRETKNHAEIKAFWQSMGQDIQSIKRDMEESLATGEALLSNLKQKEN